MRCISCSTPSMRKRTTSASSCGSKWMSEAPSSAAWKRIELTSRTSGTSETPSSASRSVRSSSSSSGEQLLFLVDRGARAVGLGGANELADRAEDVLAGGDAELERMPRREPELVEPVQVRGIGDRDVQPAVLEGERDRTDALEHVQRQLARRFHIHALGSEVDRAAAGAGRRASSRCLRSKRRPPRRARPRASASAGRGRARARACPRGRASSRPGGRSRARPTRSRRTAWTGARRPARSRACPCEATGRAVPGRSRLDEGG